MKNLLAIIILIPAFFCVNYPVDTTGDLYEMESVWQYLKTYSIWQERVPKSAFEYDSPEMMLFNMYDTLKGAQYTCYDTVLCKGGACGISSVNAEMVRNVSWDSLSDSTALVGINDEFKKGTYDSLLTAMQAMNSRHFFPNIILDLRNNGGGDIEATDSIIEAILPPHTPYLVETYRKYDPQNRSAETIMDDTQVTKGPQHFAFEKRRYAVLVNSYSASASEMLVAALKDGFSRKGNADTVVIVGETTWGKGIGQICIKRDYLHRQDIKITFMRMKGVTKRTGNYHGKGIDPDIVIHDWNQQEEVALKILDPSARLKKVTIPHSYTVGRDQFPAEMVITAPLDEKSGTHY
jgi:hypothetical protein